MRSDYAYAAQGQTNDTTNTGVLSGQVPVEVKVLPAIIAHRIAQLRSTLIPHQMENSDVPRRPIPRVDLRRYQSSKALLKLPLRVQR